MPVVDVLRRFAREHPDDCVRRAGASAEMVRSVEDALLISLPPELIELLHETNGFDLFGRLFVMYGVHAGEPPYRYGDVVKNTRWHRENSDLPPDATVVGQRASGDLVLAIREGKQWKYAVVDLEDGGESSWPSLGALLEAEIDYWHQVRDAT